MISIKRDLKDGGLTPEGDGERVPAVNLGENFIFKLGAGSEKSISFLPKVAFMIIGKNFSNFIHQLI